MRARCNLLRRSVESIAAGFSLNRVFHTVTARWDARFMSAVERLRDRSVAVAAAEATATVAAVTIACRNSRQ